MCCLTLSFEARHMNGLRFQDLSFSDPHVSAEQTRRERLLKSALYLMLTQRSF